MEPKGRLYLVVENARGEPVSGAEGYLTAAGGKARIALRPTGAPGSLQSPPMDPGDYLLHLDAAGYAPESIPISLQQGNNSLVAGLGKPGDRFYWQGGMKVFFEQEEAQLLLTVRGEGGEALLRQALEKRQLQFEKARPDKPGRSKSHFSRVLLKRGEKASGMISQINEIKREVKSAGLELLPAFVVKRGEHRDAGITDELFVRFRDDVPRSRVDQIAEANGLRVNRQVLTAGNAFLLQSKSLIGYDILDLAEALLALPETLRAEPEIMQEIDLDAYTPNDTLYNLQNHLPLINADEGWELLMDFASDLHGGSPDICIAVFDGDGVAPNHPDLTANLSDGNSKLLQSFDFASYSAQTVANLDGDHGTQCAGTATAAFDNSRGIAGVAPNCRLIGAELPTAVTGTQMADAFLWAAGINNGSTQAGFPALPTQPADVISNSWGVTNGALGTALQAAFDRLTDDGRGGRGAVVTFSTGNLGYVQFSNIRRYAAYNRTIAVGASINSNPTSPVNTFFADPNGNTNNLVATVDRRAFYNPFGPEMDIVAPSHTCYAAGTGNLVDPTTSTVRVGTGALDGCAGPTTCNDYATSFGGTSHASPTIAGTAALILSCNPHYTWDEVRDVLRRTATRIDAGQANATGAYVDNDGDGVNEFSQWYGYGRVNVEEAVRESLNMHILTHYTD